MFTIQGLDHIVLRTFHLDRMLVFYCEVLGCQIERVNNAIGLTHLRAGEQLIDLLKIDHLPKEKNLEHFCLRIHPFSYPKLQQYFHEQGITTLRYDTRYNALGHGYSFYVQDPDGNEIEFIAGSE